ncbi:TldD/PmbA family protein [bacterium]|nr:TldD/PmbA family protein [bacterium]
MEELIKKLRLESIEGDIFSRRGTSTVVTFEANKLKSIESSESSGIGLRVLVGNKIGYASQYGIYEPDWLLEKAKATANIETNMQLPSDICIKEDYDDALDSVSIEDLTKLGKDIIDKILSSYPDVICNVEIGKDKGESLIVNTKGIDCSRSRASLTVAVHVNRIKGTDMLDVYEETVVKRFDNLDTDILISKIFYALESSKNIVKPSKSKLPVVFTPKAVYVLLLPLMSALSGKILLMGASPLQDKVGKKFFDEKFTLIDDPTNPEGLSMTSFDDEGTLTKVLPLVDSGIVGEFYFDLHTASLLGREPNGHGFRGGLGQPSPGLTNLIINPGDTGIRDIISSFDEVLVVDQMMGVGQGNILSGEFSVNIHLGFLYRKGEVLGRVKDSMLAGNAYNALGNIAGLSSEREWIGGSLYSPYICIPELTVVSKE